MRVCAVVCPLPLFLPPCRYFRISGAWLSAQGRVRAFFWGREFVFLYVMAPLMVLATPSRAWCQTLAPHTAGCGEAKNPPPCVLGYDGADCLVSVGRVRVSAVPTTRLVYNHDCTSSLYELC